MLNNRLEDTNYKVKVQIDNAIEELTIQSIVKNPTFIYLNQSLNTPLNDDIQINATLCSIVNIDDDNALTDDDVTNNFHYPYTDVNAIENIDIASTTSFLLPNNTQLNKIAINGIVNIKIYNDDNVYYNEDVYFHQGDITASIPNTLPLGEYKCDISFLGNKYYLPYQLTINFNIERRLAICNFETSSYFGHLTETLHITGTLKDNSTKHTISNCIIQYDFDGKTFSTITDENGVFSIAPTIPDGNILHCNQAMTEEGDIVIELGEPYEEEYDEELIRDDDGNIVLKSDVEDIDIDDTNINTDTDTDISTIDEAYEYPADAEIQEYQDTSYLITFNIDNDIYYLNNDAINVTVIKAPTYVTINTGEYDINTRTVTFDGYVMADISDTFTDVHYGKIQIAFPTFNYTHNIVKVDTHGRFSTQVNMADIYAQYNNTDIDELIPYQGYSSIYDTNVIIKQDTYNLTVGEPIVVEVSIKSVTNELVKDGMVKFDLYDSNNKLVYTYATELDNTGLGVFVFNTSRAQQYTLKAQYIGLFGYNNSEKTINIIVED